MPRRLAASLIAALVLAAPAPVHAAAPVPEGAGVLHLERAQGSGYTRPQLASESCLVEALAARPAAAGFDGRVRFVVQRDGSLADLTFLDAPPTAMAQAVQAALQACPWQQGLDPAGSPVVVRVTLPIRVKGRDAAGEDGRGRPPSDRALEPGPPPPPVVLGGGSLRLDGDRAVGFRRPVLDDPPCLTTALQRERAAAGLVNTVKFAVLRDGSVSHFSFLDPVGPEVERAVVAAFEACSWKPALDPQGVPLAVWVVQPLKIEPLPPPAPVPQPLFP